jgi:uncharacterized membrane protein
MSWLVGALAFIAGLVIAIRWLAAIHSIADLWYTMRTAWRGVLARVIGWSGVAAAAILVVEGGYRTALLAGMAFHGVVFVGTYAFIVVVGGLKPRRMPVVE